MSAIAQETDPSAQQRGFDLNEQSTRRWPKFNAECFSVRRLACNALDSMGPDYRVAYPAPACPPIMRSDAGLAITASVTSPDTADMAHIGEKYACQDALGEHCAAAQAQTRYAGDRVPG